MENIFSVQYESKGEKVFLLPFSINNKEDIKVWINDNLQPDSKYYIENHIKEFNYSTNNINNDVYFAKVIFYSVVGSNKVPKIVTIEKKVPIERKTDFKNFTNFRADSLNLELNNFINILKSLQQIVFNSVQKSKLEDKKTVVIVPKSIEGKGIYWGKNGELLNTDQNINDLLNELANSNPNINSAKIQASKVVIDIKDTVIKKSNAQEFLQLIDSYIAELKNKQAKLIENVKTNTSTILQVNNKVQDIITPNLNQAQNTIINIQKDISNIKETLTQVSASGGGNMYTILNAPRDKNNNIQYLIREDDNKFRFRIVNISPSSPLILNFAYKGTSIKFVADDISKFVIPHCLMVYRGKGRYYVTAELNEDGQVFLLGHNVRPYFSYLKPTKEEVKLHGCNPEEYFYFVIKDMTICGSRGRFKDTPLPYMYLGYYEVNESNEIISDVTYFTNNKTFDYYLDVKANSSYIIPNFLGCNSINVEIYAIYENNFLIPICNQSKLNKDFPNVLEMGTNFSFNFDQINIDTAANGVYGYYKGNQLIYAQEAKLKVVVTRKF